MDLSVPFAKAANAIEKSIGSAATKATTTATTAAVKIGSKSTKGINLKSWRVWVVIAGALIVLYLLFKGAMVPTEHFESAKKQEEPIEQPTSPVESNIDIARRHDEMMDHSTGREKMYHFQMATEAYERSLYETPPNSPEFGEISFRLGKLFHQGISEQYDQESDTKLPGIPPNTEKAIAYYQQAIKLGYHSALLELASIFHWGNVGFKPNREYAKHLYGVVLKVGQEYEQGIARDRLRQMHEEEGKIVGTVLDGVEGVGNGFSSNDFNMTPFTEEFSSLKGADPNGTGKDELTKDIDENYVDEVMSNDLQIRNNRIDDITGNTTRTKSILPNKPRIEDDAHNARDHMVMNTVRQSLEKLRSNTHIEYDIPTTMKMIHQYIIRDCDLSEEKRKKAIVVLKQMASGMGKAGHDQAKELEALYLVYNRILSKFRDRKDRNNVLDNLVTELSECIEYGDLVCPEGRINRIVDTLNYIDDDVRIKPKWALNQEMMNRAALIRKKMLEMEKSEVKDALMAVNPTARQRMLVRDFTNKFQREIKQQFTKIYVDSGIMTKDLLNTELNKWLNDI